MSKRYHFIYVKVGLCRGVWGVCGVATVGGGAQLGRVGHMLLFLAFVKSSKTLYPNT